MHNDISMVASQLKKLIKINIIKNINDNYDINYVNIKPNHDNKQVVVPTNQTSKSNICFLTWLWLSFDKKMVT